MSEGNAALPSNAIPMMKFNCAQCKGEMVAPMPQFRFFNYQDVSGLMFTHTRMYKCPTCGVPYLCMLGGVNEQGQIMLSWTPVQTKESALVSGDERSLKQAIDASELGSKLKAN